MRRAPCYRRRAMANTPDDPSSSAPADSIDTPFGSALSERYLVYALSTITARSLPDLRDGLKPVHRRLLWAMRAMRLDPSQGYKKSARVVGDVIGKNTEERRVGKEGVSTCRSRWSAEHKKK